MRRILPLLFVSACAAPATIRTTYTFRLDSVSEAGKIENLGYQNELLSARWKIDTASIAVELANRSKQPITFRWNETTFHDVSHLPPALAAGSTVSISLHPMVRTHRENAYCFKATKVDCTPGYITSRRRYYAPKCLSAGENLKQCSLVRVRDPVFDKPLAEGETFSVELPLSIGEEQKKLAFVFKVDSVKREKVKKPDDEGEEKVIVGACPCPKRYRKDEP